MTTPLFPRDDERIIIEQGKVGNCYLLAGLDCVLNEMQGGRAFAKQRFVQYPDGSVRVQIPRNSHSPHLNPAVIGSKYILDQSDPNFDYWIIPKSEVDRMDAPDGMGARSNCLAVKIMERLSAYYYVNPPKVAGMGESIIAHNQQGVRYNDPAPVFVGNLLGVHADTIFGASDDKAKNFDNNIDKLIRLKLMNPRAPVFLGLKWGQRDAYGQIHGLHAVRVERIVPDGRGSYNVHIVNPWNNDQVDTQVFSIDELRERDAYFCHYSQSPQHAALTRTLLNCRNTEIGKHVYNNSALMNTLITLQNKFPHLGDNPRVIELLVDTHKNNPQLFPIIDTLLNNINDSQSFARCIEQSQMREDYLVSGVVNQLFNHPNQRLFDSLPIRLTNPILCDMAVVARERGDIALQQYLSSPKFVGRLIEGAINDVASYPSMGGDKVLFRSVVEQDLVDYYLSGDKSRVRERNLTDFINAGIIDIKGLDKHGNRTGILIFF